MKKIKPILKLTLYYFSLIGVPFFFIGYFFNKSPHFLFLGALFLILLKTFILRFLNPKFNIGDYISPLVGNFPNEGSFFTVENKTIFFYIIKSQKGNLYKIPIHKDFSWAKKVESFQYDGQMPSYWN